MNLKLRSNRTEPHSPNWLNRRQVRTFLATLLIAMCGGIASAQEPLPAPGTSASDRLEVIEFRQLPLREAMRVFSLQTGINVVASSEAADVPVSIYLQYTTPMAALKTLTKTHGLFYRNDEESGIISIYTNEEFQANLQNFRDQETRVFTLLYPNAVDAASAIADVFGSQVVLNLGNNTQNQVFTDLSQRLQRFDLIDGRSQGLGLFGGTGQGGGIGGGGFGGGGFGGGGGGFGGGGFGGGGFGGGGFSGQRRSDLTINSAAQRQGFLNQSQQPLANIDASSLTPEQLQAIVAAQQGGADQSAILSLLEGQAQIYVTVIQRQNQVVVRVSDPDIMDQVESLIEKIDIPTPMVLLEVKVMELTLTDGFNSVFDYQFNDGSNVAGQFTAGDILPPGVTMPVADANGVIPNLSPSPSQVQDNMITGNGINLTDGITNPDGLLFQVVNDHFRFRMQLLESKNRVTMLASPLLLTANNEVSKVFVGREVPINRSFQGGSTVATAGNTATTGASTAIEFRPVGTTLLITPSINADRTVTLRILQEQSDVSSTADVFIPDGTGGFTSQNVDVVSSKTVSGTIVAKDGLSVAIGGLIDEQASDTRSEVPVIGKLPVVGFFFRRQNTGRTRSELVVMVRPYVFNTPSESACLSRHLMEDLSIHPNAPEGRHTLGTFAPHEAVRPNPPVNPLQTIFRFHSIEPKVY